MKLIDKDDLVAKIRTRLLPVIRDKHYDEWEEGQDNERRAILDIIDTIEVKDSLTWEDIRELYIIFAEIDAEIEFCKTNIKPETICYYKEVLKRFKTHKGE
jgi:hypothetical protein